MREAKYPSRCPKCGIIDILGETEIKKTVHCQRCYHHYDFKINDIKSRIGKDSEGTSDYTYVYIDEMDWLVEQAEKVDELISIALWSIRRLPTNYLKHNALHELKKVVGNDHKHSEFIDKCISEGLID